MTQLVDEVPREASIQDGVGIGAGGELGIHERALGREGAEERGRPAEECENDAAALSVSTNRQVQGQR